MYIIQFLLIVFVIAFAIIGFVIWRAWRKIHKAVDQFNHQFGGGAEGFGSDANGQSKSTPHRSTTTESGETIIDTRSQEDVDKKIFSKDEGEYVDYEVRE